MHRRNLLILLLILLSAGWTGRSEAMNIGDVGQSVTVSASGLGYLERTGLGTVSGSLAGTYSDPWGGPSSWGAYDTRAQASAGVLRTYIDFSYNNGGDWYDTRAQSSSADIFDVYDPAHANSLVGITFNAYIHGTLSSFGGDVGGSASSYIQFGEYDSTYSSWGGGPWNQLFYDQTSDGITTYGPRTPSYTYYLALDSTGHGQMAALSYLYSSASEGASKWSPSSGGVEADYYSTVSMSVTPQYGTTTITSQGGWNVVNAASVPEPSTLLLLGSGLVGLAGMRRRYKA